MKTMRFILIFAIAVCVFLFVSCDQSEELDTKKSISVISEVDDLLEKYDISIWSDIWNDYMPSVVYPLQSIFTVCFDSAVELPPMEVSATVITERITIPVSLYDIYNGNGTYGKLFRKDFRPVGHFRLNDGEEYTIEITVKILGEQQTITFEKQKVFTTS